MAAWSVGQPEPKAITRDDVARYAGVSSAVVSYVVNDGPRPVAAGDRRPGSRSDRPPRIPTERQRREPSSVGSTGLLALVVPDSSNPFFAEFALEIEKVAAERGLALLMANSNSDIELESRLIADLAARQVDGLIVSGAAGPPRARRRRARRPQPCTSTARCPCRAGTRSAPDAVRRCPAGGRASTGRPRSPQRRARHRFGAGSTHRPARGRLAAGARGRRPPAGPVVTSPVHQERRIPAQVCVCSGHVRYLTPSSQVTTCRRSV